MKQFLQQQEDQFAKALQGLAGLQWDMVEVCCPWDSPLSAAVQTQEVERTGWEYTTVMTSLPRLV